MSVEQYAAFQSEIGGNVRKVGRIYWTLSEKYFWRPLLFYEAYEPEAPDLPRPARAGYQHVVPKERDGNSWMQFLIIDAKSVYSLGQVSHNRRRLITSAAKHFKICPVNNLAELREQGFSAYRSFYRRTGYQYLSARRRKENFCRWAAALLREPGAMVLGGYSDGGLVSVSVCYLVEDTLIYASHFSDSEALRKGVGELMFHSLREIAAGTRGIRQVILRRYAGGNGMDKYYLMRGAELVRKPAKLHVPSAVDWLLKCCLPKRRAILYGISSDEA